MALEILHKKSAVSQKLPLPTDLGLGEIALNYHADGPFLTCKDTNGNVRKLNHVWVGASAPTSPTVGDPWLDTSVDPARLLIYKDAVDQWVAVVNINNATATTAGIVRLASATDVTNGTPGRIVDAAQLQAETSGYVSSISASSPLLIGGTSQQPSISLTYGSAGQVFRTNLSGTGVEFSDDIDLPGTLSVQGGLSVGTATITTGTGAPEGSVSATVGSLYLRTDGTPNNTLYVKESGSGNSGWGAVPTQALLVN